MNTVYSTYMGGKECIQNFGSVTSLQEITLGTDMWRGQLY
jgi:hypothetical protein